MNRWLPGFRSVVFSAEQDACPSSEGSLLGHCHRDPVVCGPRHTLRRGLGPFPCSRRSVLVCPRDSAAWVQCQRGFASLRFEAIGRGQMRLRRHCCLKPFLLPHAASQDCRLHEPLGGIPLWGRLWGRTGWGRELRSVAG